MIQITALVTIVMKVTVILVLIQMLNHYNQKKILLIIH